MIGENGKIKCIEIEIIEAILSKSKYREADDTLTKTN